MSDKICPQCAEAVKLEAKICRFCRFSFPIGVPLVELYETRESKKSKRFSAGLMLVGCVLGSSYIMAHISSGKSGSPAPPPNNPVQQIDAQPMHVTARELAEAYEKNEVAAQREYGGHTLSVTGVIQDLTLDFKDRPVVHLEGVNQYQPVQASFDKSSGDIISQLDKGMNVRVICSRTSEIIGAAMLKECNKIIVQNIIYK